MTATTKQIQLALIKLNISVGPNGADGVWGRNTIAGVKAFQKVHGLDPDGVVGNKTSAVLFGAPVEVNPSWVSEANRYMGLQEVRDAKKLDSILDIDASEVPWCGAFQAFVIAQVLPSEALPVNPLWALNWQNFGRRAAPIDGNPYFGSIAVFKRASGGHVGQATGHDEKHVHVLGGNQSNMVSVTKVAKSQLVAYRWPSTVAFIGHPMGYSTFTGKVFDNKD